MPDRVVLNADWCKGCYICVAVCPRKVLEVDEDTYLRGFHPVRVARPEDCTACQQCELLCPDLAIAVTEDDAQRPVTLVPHVQAGESEASTTKSERRD